MKHLLLGASLMPLMVACGAATSSSRDAARAEPPRVSSTPESPPADPATEPADIEHRVRMAMVVPAQRSRLVPASGRSAPCTVSVAVTDLGGVAVSYRATPGEQQELRAAVHVMAARHNERVAQSPAANDAVGELEARANVDSIAVVEDTSEGARVVLVPEEAWQLPELYMHLEMHAPDLLPAPLRAKVCPPEPLGAR